MSENVKWPFIHTLNTHIRTFGNLISCGSKALTPGLQRVKVSPRLLPPWPPEKVGSFKSPTNKIPKYDYSF